MDDREDDDFDDALRLALDLALDSYERYDELSELLELDADDLCEDIREDALLDSDELLDGALLLVKLPTKLRLTPGQYALTARADGVNSHPANVGVNNVVPSRHVHAYGGFIP